MATFTWKIDRLESYQQHSGQTNVVFKAHWTAYAEEEYNGNVLTSSYSGSSNLTPGAGEDFTPYNQLTEEQVVGWAWATYPGKDFYESYLQSKINEQKTPLVVLDEPLPWAPPSEPSPEV